MSIKQNNFKVLFYKVKCSQFKPKPQYKEIEYKGQIHHTLSKEQFEIYFSNSLYAAKFKKFLQRATYPLSLMFISDIPPHPIKMPWGKSIDVPNRYKCFFIKKPKFLIPKDNELLSCFILELY